jgi:membrane protein implicated in regulation of membrane protease activity
MPLFLVVLVLCIVLLAKEICLPDLLLSWLGVVIPPSLSASSSGCHAVGIVIDMHVWHIVFYLEVEVDT